jgi:hypothetical protein
VIAKLRIASRIAPFRFDDCLELSTLELTGPNEAGKQGGAA